MDLRCHHCSHWLGETFIDLRPAAVCENPQDRTQIAPPRFTWRCPSCKWVTVLLMATDPRVSGPSWGLLVGTERTVTTGHGWRRIELKATA
jgi:hypothetical protein